MNKRIKIRREGDQIVVERSYKIVLNRIIQFDHQPNVDLFIIKDHVIEALESRMDFCLKQLDSEILPAEDKVFNEMGVIFSPSKGIYFDQESYESMENALKKLEKNSPDDIFDDLDLIEIEQITKALIAFDKKLPDNESHYLSGLIVECLSIAQATFFSKKFSSESNCQNFLRSLLICLKLHTKRRDKVWIKNLYTYSC